MGYILFRFGEEDAGPDPRNREKPDLEGPPSPFLEILPLPQASCPPLETFPPPQHLVAFSELTPFSQPHL